MLLICIAFHYADSRFQYLKTVLHRFLNTYEIPLKIIVDTNSYETEVLLREQFPKECNSSRIEIKVHEELIHPFCLTWAHRFHFKRLINDYALFMYLEDDMDVPFENFKNYIQNFSILWPRCIPSFIRVERDLSGNKFCSDQLIVHRVPESQLLHIGSKRFICLQNDYCAFWIMPQEALIARMTPNFARWETEGHIRETAASFPNWELKMPALVEVDSQGKVSEKCYTYHLPNNYVLQEGTPLGKLSVNSLLEIV
jgi:hypothetical protein